MINQNIDNKANNYDVESYKKRKKEQKASAYKMIDEALEELKTNPKSIQSYLNIQSRFDNYSPRNALLINKQCPNARQLKTKSDWLDEKANFINSKPNIITILEPGTPYEIDGKKLTSYNAKSMIDISETNLKYNVKKGK